MALLAASPLLIGSPSAFFLLCGATGALGLGFGATVMALNTLIESLFPGRTDGAVLALNALLGLGTALAPLLIMLFTALGAWWALPLAMTDHAYSLRTDPSLPAGVRMSGIDESFPTTAPISLYGATKLASEALALEYGSAFGLPVWVNRWIQSTPVVTPRSSVSSPITVER